MALVRRASLLPGIPDASWIVLRSVDTFRASARSRALAASLVIFIFSRGVYTSLSVPVEPGRESQPSDQYGFTALFLMTISYSPVSSLCLFNCHLGRFEKDYR